jgi:membrane protein
MPLASAKAVRRPAHEENAMAQKGSDEVQPAFGARRRGGRAGVHNEASAEDTRGRVDGREKQGQAPDQPTEVPVRGWAATLKRTVKEFRDDGLMDWAAALTYYGVLALFPALVCLVALVGLLGQYPQTVNALLGIVEKVGPGSAADTLRSPITEVVKAKGGAGALLGLGLAGALWSASGYIGAFTRATNVIYETKEGRPFWKLKPLQILLTLVMVFALALLAISLVVTGSLAHAIGDAIGLGSTAVTLWNWLKWPVMVVIVMLMFALLYWAAPNVKQPGIRWVSPGGIVAVVIWIVTSAVFGLYVAHFGSYNKTYGSLGGVVAFLVWLWISNMALLFGAELNSELERQRELEAGVPAEHQLQLEPRDRPKGQDRGTERSTRAG